MADKKNVFEDIIDEVLDRSLGLKFDICRCSACRDNMRRIVVDKFPPFYADPDQYDYRQVYMRLSSEYFNRIMEEVMKAIDYVGAHPPHQITKDSEEFFSMLLDRIHQDRGLDFSQYHRGLLKRRVALRLKALGLDSYADYLKVLARDPKEYNRLFEVLTINVSEFFRDLPVWGKIGKLLETNLVTEPAERTPFIIWSAACAHGEEPYSVAILVKELGETRRPVKIYASDIDDGAIENAHEGVYDVHRLKNVTQSFRSKYFVRKDERRYAIKDEIKRMVTFKKIDLIKDAFVPNTDFILCRNVFIYFTKPLQEHILNKFYHSLKDGGYLVIGRSETIITEARLIFRDEDMDARIYRKAPLK